MDDIPALRVLTLKSKPLITRRHRFVVRLLYYIVLLSIAVCEVIFIIRFHTALRLLFQQYLNSSGLAWFIMLCLFMSYVTIVIHEYGHVLSARLVGFRFLLFIAGPLKIKRTRWGIRICLNKSRKVFEGRAASIPLDARHLRRRELIVFAGGPLANLLQAIVLGSCSFWLGFALHPTIVTLLRVAAIIAFVFFVGNMLPMRTGDGLLSDGAGILLLLKGGPALERWCATLVLEMEVAEGRLPREWDADLLLKVKLLLDGTPEEVTGCVYNYYWFLDMGDIAGARVSLERMLAARMGIPVNQRRRIALEAAYFEARYHHNATEARMWLAQTKDSTIEPCTRLRVEAAVLLAEGNKEKASTCIRKGLAAAKNALYLGTERMEKIWLLDMQEQLES